MMEFDYRAAAKQMTARVTDLQRRVLLIHAEAILKGIHMEVVDFLKQIDELKREREHLIATNAMLRANIGRLSGATRQDER